MNRPAFQERMDARSDQTTQSLRRQPTAPTLWKLSQAGAILQEAIRDVVGAVKVCSTAAGSARLLQKMADENREHAEPQTETEMRWQTLVHAAMQKQVHDTKIAESDWHCLASTLKR